jgi:protein SCO1
MTTAVSTLPEETGIRRFFSGAGLPVFLLTAVGLYEMSLIAIVFAPEGWGVWSDFSVEFKIWCFGYDTRTGGMAWAAFWVMLAEPLFIAATAGFLWRKALQTLTRGGFTASIGRAVAAGALVASVVVGGLFAYGKPSDVTEEALPFPGERIRTQLTPPAFRYVDQKGAPLGLEDLKGRVVLVTGVYAMCSTSCPEILRNVKGLLDILPADVQARVAVVALSLNPEYDTADLMDRVAEGYGFTYPQFRYLNGLPQPLGETLQALGFSRSKNSETGMIDHANLVLLVDGHGKIAYRFNLSERHTAWLREATLSLARETPL